MKKIFYPLPFILLVFSLIYIYSGCSKDEQVVAPVDENVDKQSASAKNYSQVLKLLTDANAFSWAAANNLTPSTGNCPNTGNDTISTPRIFVVDYGPFPGCVLGDGVKRSGSYSIVYRLNAARDSIYSDMSFLDFRIYKTSENNDTNMIRITGTLSFSSKMLSSNSYRFHAGGEVYLQTLSNGNKDVLISSLNGTAALNDLSNIFDDEYLLSGTGKITDNGLNVSYDISVNASSPLKILSSCRYPVSGIANFAVNGGGSANCDFSPNANACDAIVKMSIGTFSKTVDLSSFNF